VHDLTLTIEFTSIPGVVKYVMSYTTYAEPFNVYQNLFEYFDVKD